MVQPWMVMILNVRLMPAYARKVCICRHCLQINYYKIDFLSKLLKVIKQVIKQVVNKFTIKITIQVIYQVVGLSSICGT